MVLLHLFDNFLNEISRFWLYSGMQIGNPTGLNEISLPLASWLVGCYGFSGPLRQ